MIVELTGLPGCGKSYFLKQLSLDFGNKNNKISLSLRGLWYKKFGKNIIVNFLYEITVFFFSFHIILIAPSLYFSTINNCFKFEKRIFHKLNLIRNSLLKFGERSIGLLLFKNKVLILDEGISHLPFNFFLEINSKERCSYIERYINKLVLPDIIIFITSDSDVNLERLIERGHKRINTTNKNSLKNLLISSTDLVEQLINNYQTKTKLFLIKSEDDSDIQDNSMYENIVTFITSKITN